MSHDHLIYLTRLNLADIEYDRLYKKSVEKKNRDANQLG